MKLLRPVKGVILPAFILLVLCSNSLFGRVRFIENKGQWNPLIQYAADVPGGRVFLGKQWIRYAFVRADYLKTHHAYTPFQKVDVDYESIFLDFVNPLSTVKITSDSPGTEYYNYYEGNNPSKWASHVKPFFKVKYENLFHSISLLLESEDDAIKQTYYVAPGGNVRDIQYRISGADNIQVVNGELQIKTWLGEIHEFKPYAYQEQGGERQQVACNFVVKGRTVSFEFPSGYNADIPLVIDPTMIFATYSGSYADNFGFTGTYDKEGFGYSGGTVYFTGFPVKAGVHKAYDATYNGDSELVLIEEGYYPGDVGILKYSRTGDSILFATYLGGRGHEQPNSMVVDSQDRMIVFGNTSSPNFPVSKNAWQTKYKDSCDIFVCKFSKNGDSLIASTLVGGTGADGLNGIVGWDYYGDYFFQQAPLFYNYGDQARGEVIADAKGNIYVASSTMSKDFIDASVFPNAYQKKLGGKQDGCIFKLNPDFSKVLWNTLIGGDSADAAYSLQRDSKGNIFVTGGTMSPYFFSDNKTYQNYITKRAAGSRLREDCTDAYVCSFKDDGSILLNATYLGTPKYDQSYFVQLDKQDNVYLYGQTTGDSFLNKNALYSNPGSGQFITEFSHELDTVLMSATIGKGVAKTDISPTAFLVDDCGKIYISGWGGEVNSSDYGGHGGNTLNLPITSDAFQSKTDGSDFYVAVFARNMDTMLYASFFGGIKTYLNYSPPRHDLEHVDGGTSRFDKRGVIYQSVCGACDVAGSFPTTPKAWSPNNKAFRRVFNGSGQEVLDSGAHGCNNLLFKMDLSIPDLKAAFDAPTHGCSPYTVKVTNKTLNGKTFFWDFGDGTTSTLKDPPPHQYKYGGVFTLKLVVTNLYSCTTKDSLSLQVHSYYQSKPNFVYYKDTCNHLVYFDTAGTNALAQSLFWKFGDNDTTSNPAPSHYYKNPGQYKVTLITDKGTPCMDSSSQVITLNKSDFDFTIDTCSRTVTVTSVFLRDTNFLWIIDGKKFTTKYPSYTYTGKGKLTMDLIIRPKAPCDTVIKTVTFPPLSKPVAKYVFDTCSHTVKIKSFAPGDSAPVWVFGKDTIRAMYPTYTFPKSGNDTITLILPNYCKGDTGRIPIVIPAKNKALFTYTNPPCTRDYLFKAGIFDPKYRWDFGDTTYDTVANPVKHIYNADTSYRVSFIINAGKACADTSIKVVTPKRKKDAIFVFQLDSCTGMVNFFNKTDTAAKRFLWNFGDGSTNVTTRDAFHTYTQNGDYTVIMISEPTNNCADTAKGHFSFFDIGFDNLKISNVITPDGDGKNDVFTLSGINDKCMDFELEVFNRWGQLVYKQMGGPGETLSWNGTSLAGEPLAAGVYYWLIKGKAIGTKEGTVTIIR